MKKELKYITALCTLIVVSGCAKAKVYYPDNGSFNATTPGIQADAQTPWALHRAELVQLVGRLQCHDHSDEKADQRDERKRAVAGADDLQNRRA